MLRRGLVSLSLLATLSAVAAADNVISEWGGAQGGYLIRGGDIAEVVITAPGTYKFQALDPNGPSGLGIINHITVDPNCPTGTVTVSVVSPSGGNGALHLKEINLSNASESNIHTVSITGELAELGEVRATNVTGTVSPAGPILNDVFLDRLDGSIWCHGLGSITVSSGTAPAAQIFVWTSFSGTMNITGTPWIVVLGAMSGTIEVTGDAYSLLFLDFPQSGSVTVHGDVHDAQFGEGDLAGTFHITGDLVGYVDLRGNSLTGSLIVDGEMGANGAVWIQGLGANIAGLVQIGGDCHGVVVIGPPPSEDQDAEEPSEPWPNDLSGTLAIGGDLTNVVRIGRYLTGAITVGGDLTSDIIIVREMADLAGDLSGGHITIHGSLAMPAGIFVDEGFRGSTEFIAIDYNGGDVEDTWELGLGIKVGNVWYFGNTPSARVIEASDCKGDMNNDMVVDVGDINPFVLALSNPSAYALASPGLGGSMVFHGDLNCDGTFGFASFDDINPFIQRLTEGCCDPNCGDCPGDNAGRPSAKELAAMLAANVDPELYDSLVTLVGESAGQQDNEADAAYWEAVYYALIE